MSLVYEEEASAHQRLSGREVIKCSKEEFEQIISG